jgi:hypothetical protein
MIKKIEYEDLTTEFIFWHEASEVTAHSFDKKDFNILARTGKKLTAPAGYSFRLRNPPENYLLGCTVLETPYIDPKTGEFCVVLGSCTGQAPFMPEASKKKVKCGNVEFKSGDYIAILELTEEITPVWAE